MVPVPMPTSLAVLSTPVPFANSLRTRSSSRARILGSEYDAVCPGASEPSVNPLDDDGALELREHTHAGLQSPARGRA
jgi:hypothetical protein